MKLPILTQPFSIYSKEDLFPGIKYQICESYVHTISNFKITLSNYSEILRHLAAFLQSSVPNYDQAKIENNSELVLFTLDANGELLESTHFKVEVLDHSLVKLKTWKTTQTFAIPFVYESKELLISVLT